MYNLQLASGMHTWYRKLKYMKVLIVPHTHTTLFACMVHKKGEALLVNTEIKLHIQLTCKSFVQDKDYIGAFSVLAYVPCRKYIWSNLRFPSYSCLTD